jgi:ketosteroid isomerase-like protein
VTASPTPSTDPRVAALAAAYEGLTPASLPALLALYAEAARFKDPFNDVHGRAAIARVFEHMFETLHEARFVVTVAVCQGDHAFLTWDFHCRRQPTVEALVIRGASHLVFDGDGRVAVHRDYWDAAEELYAKLPVLGALARWAQRRLRAPGG